MRKRVNIFLSLLLYLFIMVAIFYSFLYYTRYSIFLVLPILIIPSILNGIIIFLTNRLVDVKLSWIMVTLCLPLLGVFLYWVFGRPYRFRRKQKVHLNIFKYYYQQEDWCYTKTLLQNKEKKFADETISAFTYTTRISFRPLYNNTNIEILSNGPAKFQQLLKDIKNAEHYIFINYFIISEGELLDIILHALQKKVSEGVKIWMIYDHVGSYFGLSYKQIKKIKKMGINIYRFAPIRLPFLTGTYNFRNHRKDIIIDGQIGYTGGINLADNYIYQSSHFGFWRDTQIRIEGEAVKTLELIFLQDWQFITGKILDVFPNNKKRTKIKSDKIVQIIDDGPLTKETIQKDLFIKYITMAKYRVWINSPYLIPTADLITALRNSAYSGVDVRLCLPGISDKFLLLDLSRTYYDSLLEAGVKIYEYTNVFNHSKMGIFDYDYTVIGSTNLDYRSLYSDHQTLVAIYDKETNLKLSMEFNNDFQYSNLLKSNPLLSRSKFYYRVFLPLFQVFAPLF